MKFIIGVLTGIVLGMFVLAGTVGGFIAGLFLGWELFYPEDEESSGPKIPDDAKIVYHRMGEDEPPGEKAEEVTAT